LARRGYSIALHYRTSEAEARETADSLLSLGVEVAVFKADLTQGIGRQGHSSKPHSPASAGSMSS